MRIFLCQTVLHKQFFGLPYKGILLGTILLSYAGQYRVLNRARPGWAWWHGQPPTGKSGGLCWVLINFVANEMKCLVEMGLVPHHLLVLFLGTLVEFSSFCKSDVLLYGFQPNVVIIYLILRCVGTTPISARCWSSISEMGECFLGSYFLLTAPIQHNGECFLGLHFLLNAPIQHNGWVTHNACWMFLFNKSCNGAEWGSFTCFLGWYFLLNVPIQRKGWAAHATCWMFLFNKRWDVTEWGPFTENEEFSTENPCWVIALVNEGWTVFNEKHFPA